MHRLTARFLLILLLASIFAPVALAISAPAPHACCMRKPMHEAGARNLELRAPPACCSHDCCRPLTVSYWAEEAPGRNAHKFVVASGSAASDLKLDHPASPDHSPLSARAPPQLSAA